MNNYQDGERKRSQNLLIVEGHDENELFELIFKCFPEININVNEIWIYTTTVYQLYKDIEEEYEETWAEEKTDIDLPYVVSKKLKMKNPRRKRDFTNIVLIFDYERHAREFSEKKISAMQNYFIDAADMGKLYINYPMLESYLHLCDLPDNKFIDRYIPVSLQPGSEYKSLVKKENKKLWQKIDFPHRMENWLENHSVTDAEKRKKCCEEILGISSANSMESVIENVLQKVLAGERLKEAKDSLKNWLESQEHIQNNQTYWQNIREVFKQSICRHIVKAHKIQYKQDQVPQHKYKEYFQQLDLSEILKIQNEKSITEGMIWVLNTCIFFIAEYNFKLVTD